MTNPHDDDDLAGEYVLGTLDGSERAAATARRESEPAFDGAVSAWEERLAPLVEATPDAAPTTDLWPLILSRIASFGAAGPSPDKTDGRVIQLSRQLARWRSVAAATMALAAALALWIVIGPAGNDAGGKPQMIAILMKGGEEPAYVMSVSARDDQVAVRPIGARAPEGKSYELWIIDPSIGPPRSMGVIDPSSSVHKIPVGIPADVVARATYAVTLEPAGGSRDGKPAGPPVFVGHAIDSP